MYYYCKFFIQYSTLIRYWERELGLCALWWSTRNCPTVFGETYYWMSFVIQFIIPFVLLLSMNSIIIHKIRTRAVFKQDGTSTGNSKHAENSKTKNPESQMFAILLLVTFAFLILTTPSYVFFLYVRIVDYTRTPEKLARYYLFYNSAHKMSISNHGINFFLYVISGRKFRTDLKSLFPCFMKRDNKTKKGIKTNTVSLSTFSESITNLKP